MRDHLAHHYFDTDHAIVQDVVDNESRSARSTAVRLLIESDRPVTGRMYQRCISSSDTSWSRAVPFRPSQVAKALLGGIVRHRST
jgi:hypothetical protein